MTVEETISDIEQGQDNLENAVSEINIQLGHLNEWKDKVDLQLEKFDKFVDLYTRNEGEFKNKVCSICLEGFSKGRAKALTHCRHTFHNQCLWNWKKKNNRTCPICRSSIDYYYFHP